MPVKKDLAVQWVNRKLRESGAACVSVGHAANGWTAMILYEDGATHSGTSDLGPIDALAEALGGMPDASSWELDEVLAERDRRREVARHEVTEELDKVMRRQLGDDS